MSARLCPNQFTARLISIGTFGTEFYPQTVLPDSSYWRIPNSFWIFDLFAREAEVQNHLDPKYSQLNFLVLFLSLNWGVTVPKLNEVEIHTD